MTMRFAILGLLCTCSVDVAPLAAQTAPWRRHVIDSVSVGADGVRLADLNRDGRLDVVTGWEQGGIVRVCFQPARAALRDRWPAVTVGTAPAVEDAVPVDLDGDGNLDIVSCCEGRTRTMFVHWAPNVENLLDPDGWRTEALPASRGAQMWMFCLPLQVDGQHGVDLVVGSKGDGAAVGWWEAPANPRKLTDWKYHRLQDAGWIMSLVAVDMDHDGDTDILYSDRKGATRGVKWLERRRDRAGTSWPLHIIGATDKEVMFLNLGDLDADGHMDIVVPTRNHTVEIFRGGDETGHVWQTFQTSIPFGLAHSKSVAVADFDGDRRIDLVTTNRSVPATGPAVVLMRYQHDPFTGPWKSMDVGGPEGSKFDLIEPIDLDGDGDLDLLTCEEVSNLGVIWYENPHSP